MTEKGEKLQPKQWLTEGLNTLHVCYISIQNGDNSHSDIPGSNLPYH